MKFLAAHDTAELWVELSMNPKIVVSGFNLVSGLEFSSESSSVLSF